MIGYHFVGNTLRDGRPVPPDGVWLEYDGPVVPCKSGLHASEHPFDALQYAPDSELCLVELEGDLQSHGEHGKPVDKWAGRRRKIIRRINATDLLRRFAADLVLGLKHLWEMPKSVELYLTTLNVYKRQAALNDAASALWNTRFKARSSSIACGASMRVCCSHSVLDAARMASLDVYRAEDQFRSENGEPFDETWRFNRGGQRADFLSLVEAAGLKAP